MIIDLDSEPERSGKTDFSASVCVIGTGAAGLALCSALLKAGIDSVVLEAGRLEYDEKIQELYRCEFDRVPVPGSISGRFRMLGGTTERWGGQAIPLDPEDFQPRSWVDHSGWPIDRSALDGYYKRASEFLSLEDCNFDSDLLERFSIASPFNSDYLRHQYVKLCPHPRLRRLYLSTIAQSDHVTLLYNANVVKIDLEKSLESVEHLQIRNRNGQSFRITASKFIFCVGGIEIARLLLSNNHQIVCGLGNEQDLVGRYYQDHPSLPIGIVHPGQPWEFQRLFNTRFDGRRKYKARLSLSFEKQKDLKILNTTAFFLFDFPGSSFQEEQTNPLIDPPRPVNARQTAVHCAALATGAFFRLTENRYFFPGARIIVHAMTEQEPSPDSRVFLGDKLDTCGLPRARIDWRMTDKTLKTARIFSSLFREQIELSGMGTFDLFPQIFENSHPWETMFRDFNHHIGTTRMADTASAGVVDTDCRLFTVHNLYVVSSSVFPTSGFANPTLTIIALALRLADHLGFGREPNLTERA